MAARGEGESTLGSFAAALSSWRVGAVVLLSLSSGLPLGFVMRSMPQWMAAEGVDIKAIGLLTLVQAPYALKFLWAPLLDRYAPPFLGRKRGWIFLTQLALASCLLALALVAKSPTVFWVAMLSLVFSFFSASHDIVVDGYAVEALDQGEQAAAAGGRTALYRAAMWISGYVLISLGPNLGWPLSIGGLALIFVALMPVTVLAPEGHHPPKPLSSLKEALWLPFVGFLSRPRALEIAAFLFLYKLADNLADSLVGPFLQSLGYSEWDIGVGRGVAVLVSISLGAVVGGYCTQAWGLGRALWIFGFLQALTNLGYAALATQERSSMALYAATVLENFVSGLGTGAFSVFTMRLTERRFSATQFALLSSVFGLGRVLSGAAAGFIADAFGWPLFFVLSIPAAIPGLALLQRFAPWSQPRADVDPPADAPVGGGAPVPRRRLLAFGALGAVVGTALTALAIGFLSWLKALRVGKPTTLAAELGRVLLPGDVGGAIDAITAVACGVTLSLAICAAIAARASARR